MTSDSLIDVITSVNNIPIRLTYQRWAHIVENHDYMAGCLDLVLESLSEPDIIVTGWIDELLAVRHYPKTVITEKNVVVVYKEIDERDGFVITAFMTSNLAKLLKRGVLWQR